MAWLKRLEQYPGWVIWSVAVALFLVGAALIYNATAKTVAVYLDGERRLVRTHARSVAGLVRQIGIEPAAGDRFDPDLDEAFQDGTEIRIALAEPVRLEVGDEIITLQTAEFVPANILAQAEIRLFPGDQVLVDGLPLPATMELPDQPDEIHLRRGASIELDVDGRLIAIRSAGPTLGAALAENGIVIREGDQISPGLRTPFHEVTRATLKRSQTYTFLVDGVEMIRRAVGPTVGDALESAGVSLVGLDYAVPAADEPLPEDGEIEVVRVRERVQVDLEPLSFETLYEPDPTIEIDQRSVVDTGAYGIIAKWTRVRLEGGEETERRLVNTAQVVEPRPRIVGYGTKIVVRTLNTSSGPIQYWRAVEMYATGYSPCRSAADRCYYHTSSRKLVQKGVVAFVRRWYLQMKGWPIYVEGYGTATVEDVGGGIPGRYWIDLGYSDDDYESWNRWVTVYFLTPVPPADAIPYILR